MSYRYHGRAQVSTTRPSAWAACDRCGILYNRRDLSMERQWVGTKVLDLNNFVCKKCLDDPQPQLRAFVLPPDPPAIDHPMVEPYPSDEHQSVRITMDGTPRRPMQALPFSLRVTMDP